MAWISINMRSTFCVFLLLPAFAGFAQSEADSAHAAKAGWGGTGKVCNVCHEPYNVKYSIKQSPYYNHQVNATTFRSNRMDGTEVLIKAPGDNKCQSCHKREIDSQEFFLNK